MPRYAVTLVVTLILTAGCATRQRAVGAAATPPAEVSRSVSQGGDAAGGPTGQPTARQLIRRGDTRVTVERVDDARRRLESAAGALGAQVARLSVEEMGSAQYVLRVPPDRLDALMDSAAALGTLDRRTISADDVTEQLVDTEGRLVALRASRDRLRLLMERATTVADVVTVERELARVQAELESFERRLNSLRGAVALSELSVRLDRRRVLGPLGVLALGVGRVLGKLFVWR